MKIIVSQIPDAGIEEDLRFPIKLDGDAPALEVRAHVRVTKYGERVIVEGAAESKITLPCSRCLEEASFPLKINLNAEYLPHSKAPEDGEHELKSEELDVGYYSGDEIDIDGLVRENMLLAIPMKPLCRPDCRGICYKCGRNLNESVCECSAGDVDPRLEPLKNIKI